MTRALNIKHLEDYTGSVLDMDDPAGGIFSDRTGNTDSDKLSICQVARFPPHPDELDHAQRFASLAPNSTAIPRKRPLGFSPENRRGLNEVASIKAWVTEPSNERYGTPNKRRRTGGLGPSEGFDIDRPLLSRENHDDDVNRSSQLMPAQGSVNQVPNSQTSPTRKSASTLHNSFAWLNSHTARIPYGTPTSLSFISPQEPVPPIRTEFSIIPDSPPNRRAQFQSGAFGKAVVLDRESTKSESPELRVSVHEVADINPPSSQFDHTGSNDKPSAIRNANKAVEESSQGRHRSIEANALATEENEPTVTGMPDSHHKNTDLADDYDTSLNLRDSSIQIGQIGSNVQRLSHSVFDPIESDTESFCEKQRIHSTKRLKRVTKLPRDATSPYTQEQSSPTRRDGHFLIPPIPKPHSSETRLPPAEPSSQGDCADSQELSGNVNCIPSIAGNPGQRYSEKTPQTDKIAGVGLDRQEVLGAGLQDRYVETEGNAALNASFSPSQPADTYLQVPSSLSQDARHPNEHAADAQAPELVEQQSHREAHDRDSDCAIQEVEPTLKETEERQHGKTLVRINYEDQKRAQEAQEAQDLRKMAGQRLEGARQAEDNPATKRKTNEDLFAEKDVSEKQPSAKELIGAGKQKKAEAKDGLCEVKHKRETINNKEHQSREERVPKRSPHKQADQENFLVEQAERLLQAANGAKQLQTEKAERKKARVSSIKDVAKDLPKKSHQTPKNSLGELEQGAGREAVDAQMRAARVEDSEETNRNQDRAAIVPRGKFKQSDGKAKPREIEQGKEKTPTSRVTDKLVGQQASRAQDFSEAGDQRSPIPSGRHAIASRQRNSMTPAVPGSLIKRPSGSDRGDLASSSPLTSKSSNLDAHPRSAFKRGSSVLSRSVSFMDDEPSIPKLNDGSRASSTKLSSSSSRPSRSVWDANDDPDFQSAIVSKPLEDKSSKKTRESPSSISSNPTHKVQTTLNVTRDRKMKGRVNDPPLPSKVSSENQLVISSDDDHSAISSQSDHEALSEHTAKAGPSSRKKSVSRTGTTVSSRQPPLQAASITMPAPTSSTKQSRDSLKSDPGPVQTPKSRRACDACRKRKSRCIMDEGQTNKCVACKTSGRECTFLEEFRPRTKGQHDDKNNPNNGKRSPAQEREAPRSQSFQSLVDPELYETKFENGKTPHPTPVSRAGIRATSSLKQSSASRSPAQPVSETVSSSSGQESEPDLDVESDSQSDSETASESELEEIPSSSQKFEITRENKPATPKAQKDPTREVKLDEKNSKETKRRAHSSQISSISSSDAVPMAKNGGQVERAASQQLLRESQQSVPPAGTQPKSWIKAPRSDNLRGQTSDSGLNLSGRWPNGTRPANFRYSTLSELKKKAEGDPSSSRGLGRLSSSARTQPHKRQFLPTEDVESDSSSSEESSGNSDVEVATQPVPGPGRKSILNNLRHLVTG